MTSIVQLPKAICQELGIHTNTKFKAFIETDHCVTLIPQKSGAAKGILKGLKLEKKKTNQNSSNIPWEF